MTEKKEKWKKSNRTQFADLLFQTAKAINKAVEKDIENKVKKIEALQSIAKNLEN